jgi:aldehyde dehydrogenase (NAD+)
MAVQQAAQAQLSLSQFQLDELVAAQQAFFAIGVTRPYSFRRAQLLTLKAAIKRYEPRIIQALHSDLRKNSFEAYGTEIGFVYADISHTITHLRQWMQPRRVPTPIMFAPASSVVHTDPLGTVLIISPWNYPFQLMMAPLAAAIAGGNTALLKPSEMAPATEAIIAELINETFEPEYIAVVTGPGHLLGTQLIERHHLDHIFYTGSTAVGRIIMQQAARHLSPVTLELGGKSPCIVDETANLDWAARKIAWSKFINAGQTCVAPDYLLVHHSIKDKLAAALHKQVMAMYGENPALSPDYPRIINQRQFDRLTGYLQQGKLIWGGQCHANDLYIAPTLLEATEMDSPLWKEEIFGPLLLIKTFDNIAEVPALIEHNPYPLALYLYTGSKANEQFITNSVRFGGGCINNGLIHLGNNNLPFGGVGYSGMGQYHGEEGFRTFTRKKSMLKSKTWFDTPVWYPPVKNWYIAALKKMLK